MEFTNAISEYFVPIIGTLAACVGLATAFSPRVRQWLNPGPKRGQAKTAAAIVYRDDEVLMVKRKGKREPLTWYFPSGSIKAGEQPAVRAVEEVRQETGVEFECEKELGQRAHPNTGVYMYYFACAYKSGKASNLDTRENAKVEWVPAEKVPELVGTDLYQPVKAFLENLSHD